MAWLHAVVDVPAPEHDTAASFWSGVLGWPAGAPWPAHPELCSFEPPRGTPYVHLQTIEGPARVHIDLESDDPDATAKAADELGAESAGRHDRWRTLRSPGGLPFCVLDRTDGSTRSVGQVSLGSVISNVACCPAAGGW